MKTLVLITSILFGSLITEANIPTSPDTTQVVKKIVKTIQIDENGKTEVDSTIVYEDAENIEVFVHRLPADSKGKKVITKTIHVDDQSPMIWTSNNEESYDITVETTDGDSTKVFVMKKPGTIKEFKFNEPNFKDHKMFMYHNDDDHSFESFFEAKKSNKIDLNDPDIVSFKRETLKNGNEKITIIRKSKEE